MDADRPEDWITSTAVLDLLAKILTEPFGDHAVHGVLNGTLRDVHVAGILRLLAKKKPHSAVWEGVNHRDVGLALHTVLYHLLGGATTELRPPPGTGPAALECRPGHHVETARNFAMFKDLTRAKSTKDYALVLRLRSKVFDPSSHRNLCDTATVTKVVAGGGGSGGGDDPIDPALQARGERRTCVAMLLLCGTLDSNFASPSGPSLMATGTSCR